jgi:hypothetical protein
MEGPELACGHGDGLDTGGTGDALPFWGPPL